MTPDPTSYFVEVRVCSGSVLYFSFGLFDFEHYFSVRYHGNGSQFSILNSLMYSYNSVKKLYDCHFNFKFKMKCCDIKYK